MVIRESTLYIHICRLVKKKNIHICRLTKFHSIYILIILFSINDEYIMTVKSPLSPIVLLSGYPTSNNLISCYFLHLFNFLLKNKLTMMRFNFSFPLDMDMIMNMYIEVGHGLGKVNSCPTAVLSCLL